MPAQTEILAHIFRLAGQRFSYGLDQTPDDRLHWSPGGAARTPLELAGRAADFIGFASAWIGREEGPAGRPEPGAPPANREEAKSRVEQAYERLAGAVERLSASDLERQIAAPFLGGRMISIVEGLHWIGGLPAYFQGQLNYCQLAYGDEDPNIPPQWREQAG